MAKDPTPLQVSERGVGLLANPLLNKGTAFTIEERDALGLHGLVPTNVETIEQRADRVRAQLDLLETDLEKHVLLRGVQDYDETLFLRLLLDDIVELMPIVYTPVVGEACQKFSQIYMHHRGLFLSYPDADRMEEMLRSIPHDTVGVIVVTDGERILGLGDQGTDGLGIPIGKLSLYSACGGIDPATTLPIVLDVGTNNEERRNDPDYLGWRHERVVGPDYDAFVETFVTTVMKVFPDVMLQWEDFAEHHAHLLLDRYRDRLCTFNDDIQGTATVALAAVLSALRQSKRELVDQKVVIVGAGSAGTGIAEQIVAAMVADGLSQAEARERFYLVDRVGLLTDDMDDLLGFQTPLAQKAAAVAGWERTDPGVDQPARRHEERPALSADRRDRRARPLQRRRRARHGGRQRPAGDLPAVEPHLARRSHRARRAGVDRRQGPRRHREPVHPGRARRGHLQDRPEQQLLHLPGHRPGGPGRQVHPCVRGDVHGRRPRARRDGGRQGDRRQPPPPLQEVRAVSRAIALAVATQAQEQGLAPTSTPEELAETIDSAMWQAEYRPFVP